MKILCVQYVTVLLSVCGVYVDSHGRKCRPYEIMWPANPTSISEYFLVIYDKVVKLSGETSLYGIY